MRSLKVTGVGVALTALEGLGERVPKRPEQGGRGLSPAGQPSSDCLPWWPKFFTLVLSCSVPLSPSPTPSLFCLPWSLP